MKTYEGIRDPNEPHTAGECIVTVNGQILRLEPSLKVRNASPTGFSWGYGGSGPAQLALAILLDYFDGDQRRALHHHQDFKWRVVARWPQRSGWTITGDQIEDVLKQIRKERGMKQWRVFIETLHFSAVIDADTPEEAVEQAKELWIDDGLPRSEEEQGLRFEQADDLPWSVELQTD